MSCVYPEPFLPKIFSKDFVAVDVIFSYLLGLLPVPNFETLSENDVLSFFLTGSFSLFSCFLDSFIPDICFNVSTTCCKRLLCALTSSLKFFI